MRKILLATVIALTASVAYAQDSVDNNYILCEKFAGYAEEIQLRRVVNPNADVVEMSYSESKRAVEAGAPEQLAFTIIPQVVNEVYKFDAKLEPKTIGNIIFGDCARKK